MAKSQAVYVVESERMNTWWIKASTEEICEVLNNPELFVDENTYGELPHIYLTYISLDGSALNSKESQLINVECVAFKNKIKINDWDNIVVGDFNDENENDNDYDSEYETDPSAVVNKTIVYSNEKTHVDFYVNFPLQLDGVLPRDIYYCKKCKHLAAIKCHGICCNIQYFKK